MSNTVIKKMKLPFHISGRSSRDRRAVFELCALAAILMLAALCVPARAHAQEDQLNKVHVEPPPPKPEPGPKATLIDAITAGGTVDAVDAGSLKRARELESLGFLQITLAAREQISWTGGFGIVA